jgi:hypothetical protein
MGEPEANELVGRPPVDALPVEGDVPGARGTSPEMARSVVVLPAPLPPMSVTIWPASTLSVTPCSAWMPP